MFRSFKVLALGILCFTSLQTAHAAVEESSSATGVLETQTSKGPLGQLTVELFGWTKGSGLSRWDGLQVKDDGTPGDPVEIMNQVSILYPSGLGEMNFVVMPQFALKPFATTPGKSEVFELKDPTVGLAGTVYKNGGFSWWARFENSLPLTLSSRNEGKLIAPGAVNSVSYRFPRSNWQVEAVIVPNVTTFTNGQYSAYLYMSPRVNYIINSSWTAFTILEAGIESKKGTGPLKFVSGQPTNLGAGVKYSFAGLFVEPFVNIYPFAKIHESTTFLGLFFGGSLL